MYSDKYKNEFNTFKEFVHSKNPYIKEELFEELEKILNDQQPR